ncbi:tyrosine-type recombinase/integrase [Geobacter sp. FeAm09]|uniref:tyrosine-type recombinase/integrase n=1 Tax=Geobacter sp. FeAm09 TaxID=2597769 RepID=UPI0011EEF084|nr:tyrosine-type recombinase/integrase [Geobacter sp. FeAm09]QEM68923.1 tyrosine-type recombinase/integrase [Geobacter sp. FeAm09]
MKASMALITIDEQKQQAGSIKKFKHSKKLYADFYYYGHRIAKSTGLDDTPVNRGRVQEFLNRVFDKIEAGTFKFAEAFPGASVQEKTFFAKLEGREFNPEPNRVLIGDYLKVWLETILPTYDSHTKRNDFTQIINYRLLPYFKKMTFYELTGIELQKYVAGLKWEEGKNKERQLSASRIRNILIPLRAVWNDACDQYRWNMRSPFETIHKKLPDVEKEAPVVFRFDEWQAIMEQVDPYYKPLVDIMVMTGMIGSELAGLRKSDVGANHINIQNAIVLTVEKKKLKNGYRKRKQPITRALRERLEEVMAQFNSEYVFTMKGGRKFSYGSFKKTVWEKAFKAAGLEYKRPYTTRHTFAAWSLTLRMDPNRLVSLMGHASKQMVYEVYGNYVEGLECDAENIFNYFGVDFLRSKQQKVIAFPHMAGCGEGETYRMVAV